MYNFPRGRNNQETPRGVQGTEGDSKGRDEHRQVLRLLPHEKVFGRSEKDGLLHHGRDERTRQGQPADENPVEKEVRQNPGKHKALVSATPEQVMTKNNTGVLGIEYEEVDHVTNKSDDDWTTLIKGDSDGLTKTGQKLFQLAAESYVYSVLGAQAQTRWPIVGQGAKSLQTQDIFHKLVKDTVTQDDPVKAILDMRLAIKNTNVVLNLAISPGLILIPSDMIILKEKVEGYNNTLTLATKEMKFGVNEEVNKVTRCRWGVIAPLKRGGL